MFGLIGRLVAAPGRREELAQILASGSVAMPGCVWYVIAVDTSDANTLWVTEVWDD